MSIHDLFWFIGTVCDFRLGYGKVLNRRSKIIAVNRDRSQLLKNSDMFWKPTVAIQGEEVQFKFFTEYIKYITNRK